MCGLFGSSGGGGSSSTTSSTTTSNTSVTTTANVGVSTPVTVNNNVDTADIADAIKALAAGGIINAQANAGAQITSAKTAALGQIASAQIAAGAGPSWETVIIIASTLLGLAITFHLIKVRGLK